MIESATATATATAAAPGLPAGETLQPGDVLLMLGEGPLSQLIAWCGDSVYSHAALVADRDDLIEAAARGVRRYPLAERLADTVNYHFIDVFRPRSRDGGALAPADIGLVLAHAQSLLGVPYPLDRLATLGVIVAVRGKLPGDPLVRLVVREALDHLVRDDPSHMVCSEVVYRSFAESAARPEGRLAPEIVLEPRGTAPFPRIDWKALWEEVWPLIRPERRPALQAETARLRSMAPLAQAAGEAVPGGGAMAADDLLAMLQRVQETLGVPMPAATAKLETAPAPDAAPVPVPDPNPKLVTPLDLAATPSHAWLGRVMERSGEAVP